MEAGKQRRQGLGDGRILRRGITGFKWYCLWGVVGGMVSVTTTTAQILLGIDSMVVATFPDSIPGRKPVVAAQMIQSLRYGLTLSGAWLVNWEQDANASNLLILQDLMWESVITSGKHFSVSHKFIHQLGYQTYFDSISKFHTDNNSLDIIFSWNFGKAHGLFLSATFTSQLLNDFTEIPDTGGHLMRQLQGGFCTPLIMSLSGGLRLSWHSWANIYLGLASTKLTWIRDQRVYHTNDITSFYGVEQTKNPLLEAGLSIQIQVKKELFPWVGWDCDLLLLKMAEQPIDVNLRNLFSIRLNRLVQTQIQTRIVYEEQYCKKVQIENVISVGLLLNL